MEPASPGADSTLKRTAMHDLHLSQGARMVAFAGYDMPVQYTAGILSEHQHTRTHAGLFDVSHMGQIVIDAPGADLSTAAIGLETLIPADIVGLAPGRQRYGLLINDQGGIDDDLMIQNLGDRLLLVVNAATKDADEARLRAALPSSIRIARLDHALLALQGPQAEAALRSIWPGCADMRFMDVKEAEIFGETCIVSRSGYSGEDGFEISVPQATAVSLAEKLLAHEAVELVGLGARDSLRLEAGLCLYGSDLDVKTTPIEAQLGWAIPKVRRSDGSRAGGFPGRSVIFRQLVDGPPRVRVGLRPDGKAPVRGGALLFSDDSASEPIGSVTSGSFAPSLGAPVAMGYLQAGFSEPGSRVFAEVRGKRLPLVVSELPFVAHSYKRS